MSSAFAGPSAYPGALGQLRSAPRLTYAAASRLRREQQWRESAVRTLDRIGVLGGPSDERASSVVGHEGCVNALAWSDDGSLLASGSDDRLVCLWKLGSDGVHQVDPAEGARTAHGRSFSLRDQERGWPDPGVGLATVVETGHRANIFSVKFAPHSTSRFFTAAGDSQMRVFDLSLSSAAQHSRITPTGSYHVFPERGGACTRVLKCHTARVKRISVEGPDTFLSCAEDGEVRQTDLRVNHTCKRSRSYGQGCPAPLLRHSMELYSLSVSKQEPWLFVVAGTSEYAYLHDRRMVPRLIQQEWGVVPRGDDGALTTCVRRFGRPDEGWDVTDKAGRDGSCHITAAKIEETMGRDLLLSYSGADSTVYRFNIHDEPGMTHHDTSKHQLSMEELAALNVRMSRAREDEAAGPDEPSRMDVFRARVVSALFPQPSDGCDPHEVGSDLLTLGMLREVVEADHESVAVCRALLHLVPWASGPADFAALSAAALSELVIEDQPPVAPQVCALLRQLAETTDAQTTYEQIWSEGETYVRERWPTSWDSERRARAANVDIRELLGDSEGQPPPQDDMEEDDWTDEEDVEAMSVEHDEEESEEEASESSSDSDGGSESSEHESEVDNTSVTGNAAFNAPLTHPRQRYRGHINVDTVKQVDFVGDGFVASGSDCGRLFVWSSETGELLAAIRADGQVVNVSVAHPTLPLLAVSGIDDEIKLLGPSTARPICRESNPEAVVEANKRNGGMRNSFGYSRGLLALLQQQATMGPEAQCPTQ